jgi:diguanylate cyclase (GGDEF)-like protein
MTQTNRRIQAEAAAQEARRELAAQTQQDADQTAADADQTGADADQTGADEDQHASDSDQRLADREQHASDRDQAAADWASADEPDSTPAGRAHEASRRERSAASRERESTSASRATTTARRLATAARRDEVAHGRDVTATARDQNARARDAAAGLRDHAAQAREQLAAESGDMDQAMEALTALRVWSASLQQRSEAERTAAASVRPAAAADRVQAANDRHQAGLDELTGIFRRGTGELALTHEIDRSRRSGQSLVLAMLDVDQLKAVNDAHGHAVGDALLRDVTTAIVSTMRSYDVTVRWGGDEFVCALSNVTLHVASQRVIDIQSALELRHPGACVSAGLAELDDSRHLDAEDDTLESLIGRADAHLYNNKNKHRRDDV